MPLFESGLPQVVFYILYLSLFVGVVGGAFSTGRRDKVNPGRVKAKYGRKDSIGLTLTPFISLFLSLWFGYYSVGLLPSWSYYLGITLSILGVMLSVWAVRTLGRYMTFGVTIYNDQKVVKGGPYRFVRHPVYTASFLIFTGMGFAVQSWLAALMIAIWFAASVAYRLVHEEKALVASLGEEYISYSRRVKRFIPFIF